MCYLFSVNVSAPSPSPKRRNSVCTSHHGHELCEEVGDQSFKPPQDRMTFKLPLLLLVMVFNLQVAVDATDSSGTTLFPYAKPLAL